MAELRTMDRRAGLLREGGLHPCLAELIRAIDRLELDHRAGQNYRAVLQARDAYLAMLLDHRD